MASMSAPPPVRAPLVPVAVAVGLGVYVERTVPLPTEMLVALLLAASTGWLLAIRRQTRGSAVLLWCLAGLLAAAWHRVDGSWPADAIGHFATPDRTLVRLRGTVAEDVEVKLPRHPELRSTLSAPDSTFLLRASYLLLGNDWQPVSGLVRVTVEGDLNRLTVGDGVEVLGSLMALAPPANPGGIDFRRRWIDQRVQASVSVKSADGVLPHPHSSSWSVSMLMARVRAWVRGTLARWLPATQAGLAQALLCGEQTALQPDQFEGYLQTGVYHVLAVSGQHLVVLCAFVGFFLRLSGQSMRAQAGWLALFVLLYTLLTGARAPVVRAAVIVLAWCGARWLRRTARPVNALAFAWIAVAALNPADLANTGCQLSFIAVLILMQVVSPWYRHACEAQSPLDRLEERFRPHVLRVVYWVLLHVQWALLAAVLVWAATAPLVAHRFHLISPVAILLGPLLGVTISLALTSGLVLVLVGSIPLIAEPIAWFLGKCLACSDAIVDAGRSVPFSYGYWPDVPTWWVHLFYLGLIALLLTPGWWRWWIPALVAMLGWFALGVALNRPDVPEELRVTVLAVGHGTAVVLEIPDGRCLLYDAGSLSGPEVAQRHVASYLWYRRRTKVDEVFLSHADLDHFNGLVDLSDRFHVGQVRTTPSFSQKAEAGVQATLRHLERRGIAVVRTMQGERLEAGPVTLEVLHPPAKGPPGPENVRSLVLLVTYHDQALLLTGDLEQAGMEEVIREPIGPVDVLVAPHHGSKVSNTDRFARWCRPRLVVSSETYPRSEKPDPYTPLGAVLWRTWIHGGVTIEMLAEGVHARTHLTQQLWSPRSSSTGRNGPR